MQVLGAHHRHGLTMRDGKHFQQLPGSAERSSPQKKVQNQKDEPTELHAARGKRGGEAQCAPLLPPILRCALRKPDCEQTPR